MFERLTSPARHSLLWALHQAAERDSPAIETEHLLVGVLAADPSLIQRYPGLVEFAPPARPLPDLTSPLEPTPRRDLPLSHECKRVLAYAAEESERLGHDHIGAEHILLGMLREDTSRAAGMLHQAGLEFDPLRQQMIQSPLRGEGKPQSAGMGVLHAEISVEPSQLDSTEQARRTIFSARHEASRLKATTIDTEHLLLGLLREYRPLTNRLLAARKSLEDVRADIRRRKPPDPARPIPAHIPFSGECQRVLAFSAHEAGRLKQQVGNQHLLIGLLLEENCLAAELLRGLGITLEEA